MENMEYANSPNSGTFVTGRPDSVGSQSQFSSNSGKITLVPINSPVPSSSALSSVEGMAAVTNTGSPSKVILTDKPKRTGAMALFFRKVNKIYDLKTIYTQWIPDIRNLPYKNIRL